MKKSLVLGLLSLTAIALSTFGQGVIVLDNYDSSGPLITYGDSGVVANGVSGAFGVQGAPVESDHWTVQAYFAIGNVSIPTDPTHTEDPAVLGLTAGTGVGSTAPINGGNVTTLPAGAGYFKGSFWGVPGTLAAGGQTVTLEIAAYNGSTYDSATFRGHSEAFTIVTSANTAPLPNETGALMPAFSIYSGGPGPEPSTFALSTIATAALILVRRKKQSQE